MLSGSSGGSSGSAESGSILLVVCSNGSRIYAHGSELRFRSSRWA